MPRLWRVDLHTHTCYSPDSLSAPEALIAAARRRGLDKIAVTDHGTIRGALRLRELAPDLVIVGQEIKTTAGELIAYFVSEELPQGLSPAEAIRRLRRQGAVIGVSHPLDRLRREAMGLEALLSLLGQIDCLETFNARVLLPADNHRAALLAAQHGLPATAGSDSHHISEVGRAYVELPPFSDAGSFLESLRRGRVGGKLSGPLVHFLSTYAKLRRRSATRTELDS